MESSPIPKTEFTERHGTDRILIARKLLHENMMEAIITIHHEFLHSILGYNEGHGVVFQKHEARIRDIIEDMLNLSEK